jgi:hypothetical protein
MNSRLATIIVPLLVISLSCTCLQLGPPVYESIEAGESNDIVVGLDGTVHVLYSLRMSVEASPRRLYGVYHAYRAADGSWQAEALEGDESIDLWGPVILAQGPDGVWHAFCKYDGDFYHAWSEAGGSWEKDLLLPDTTRRVGDVTFDAGGAMHVSHAHCTIARVSDLNDFLSNKLRLDYSYQPVGGGLHTREVEVPGFEGHDHGRWSDVAVDSTGKAHVVFSLYGLLRRSGIGYVQIEAGDGAIGSPQFLSLHSEVTHPISLDIDRNDALHLVFEGFQEGETLQHAISQDGGVTWNTVKIDEVPGGASSQDFALDDAGGGHVAYLVSETHEVRYAHSGPGDEAWSVETVDTDAVEEISLALDGAGSPFILYAHATQPFTSTFEIDFVDLNLAQRAADGTWTIETVDGMEARQGSE